MAVPVSHARQPDVQMLRPPALHEGDAIIVIAPSSPFDLTLAWRGLGWLSRHFDVRFRRGMFDKAEFLAGDDARRLDELNAALSEPTARAVVAVRGGYGAGRIAHLVDWSLLRDNPKWLVGFSDITALHVEAQAVGVMSLHASMVAQLGRGFASLREHWLSSLLSPGRVRSFEKLTTLRTGRVTARLVGGNLAVLHACAVAGRLRLPPSGFVLFLEEIGEPAYRVDRMISSMLVGGHFDGLRGVVLGQFTGCKSREGARDAVHVVADLLGDSKIPIAYGMPVGHDTWNESLVLGANATLLATPADASLVVSP